MNQTSDHFLPSPEVGMRIPEFTPANPELWFSIIDRSFQAAGIVVDATKFGYALAAIVAEVARPPVFRADLKSATALEAKFNLQLVQLRVSLQQEMTEQLIGIRKLIEALGESRSRRDRNKYRDKYRAYSRSCDRDRTASGIPFAVRTGYPILRATLLGTTAGKRGGQSLMTTNESDSIKKQLQVGYHIN
ncbi:hypothetical protein ALC53_13243 [Atta colombica]|uniref:DUF7041 domain-containing protein n=1 Tax=Atta colombica TaxID=520822 RepID=A0A195AVK9_9HYME|nr:hypothetical protein ALC53_13243 [Atta colombica]